MPEHNPLNFCRGCGCDFGSTRLFDKHRVGVHEYLYDEGLKMSPPRTDGRRCLTVSEMNERGWGLNKHGRYIDTTRPFPVGRAPSDPGRAGTARPNFRSSLFGARATPEDRAS